MLYEAEHQQLTECATSFLNVCKTIVLAHQKDQCIMWNTDKNSLNAHELDFSNGATVTMNNLQYTDIIAAKLDVDKYDEVFVCHKVVMNGIEYCLQDVVIVCVDSNNMQNYFLITAIVV
jgi:hypothetical protein